MTGLVTGLVTGCGVLGAGTAGTAEDSAADARDAAYDYPSVDVADDVRANIAMLQVPEDVLAEMSSLALVWSVLDFPYAANAFATSRLDGEVAFLATQSNALEALLGRDDAAAAVEAVRAEFVESGAAGSDQSGELKLTLLDLIAAEVAEA